jgi:long-subunit fatty acid transport protein
MRTIPSAVCVATLLLIHHPRPAAAQGFSIPEMGTRKNAMGAVIGRPDDPSAVYHNPAGLPLMQGTWIYLSVGNVWLNTEFRLRPWPGSDKYIKEPVDEEGFYPSAKPSTFAVIPMIVACTNLWTDKLVAALSFYVPNAAGASFDEDGVARYHMVNSYVVAGYGTLSLAYRPWRWLSIGAGASVVYARIFARRKFFPVLPDGLDLGPLLGGDTELEIVGDDVIPVFNVGLLFLPLPNLTIGMTMITRYDIELKGDVKLTLGPDSASPGTVWEGTHTTTTNAPWIFMFGANVDVTRWLEVGAELRWHTTSQVKEQVTTIEGIDLIDELVTPKNLRDYYQFSAGVNVRPPLPIQLELMAGFHYESASAPHNTITVEQPSFAHWGVHVGGRYRITERIRVGLAYWHYFYLQRTGRDSLTVPPTNFVGSGHSDGLTLIFEARLARGIGI